MKAAAARVVELEALKERGPLTVEQEVELAELQTKVAQQKQKKKEGNAKYYQARKVNAARVAELEVLKERGPLTVEQEVELAELQTKAQPKAQQKQKKKEEDAKRYWAGKAAVARVAELEALAEQGPLTGEQEVELAELRPKAQQKQKKKEANAKRHQARKAAAARVAELEVLKEQGLLTVEQEAELAELQPKAEQKQKKRERDAGRYRAGKVAADRVAVLEALKEREQLTVEQEAELAELRPKAHQWQKRKERDAARFRAGKAAVARVSVLEELAGRGRLMVEQEAELAELQPKAEQWQKKKEGDAARSLAGKVAADRVSVLEELAGRGRLTVEQEAELGELRPKVAQQKQKQKEGNAKYRRVRMAAADRVAVLEELVARGPLAVEQEVELAELRPKAHQWQKRKERDAARFRAGKAAAVRVAELEGLEGLTEEQVAELAELRPKAQQWQKQKERDVEWHRVRKAAAVRVAELEGLEGLTEEQVAELAELRPKAQQWQKKKERDVEWHRVRKAAAVRVAELEGLEGLTVEQVAELVELRPKVQQWQKEKERLAEWSRARMAAARVAMLEKLKEQGRLTDEQEAELAELRSKVAGWGRKKKVREVTETGVGGALVADRGVGPEGVSGWAGADQVDLDGWSADVDLGAWLDRAVVDLGGVRVPQGVADAGVLLGEGAYGEFVADELLAFLGQDAATMLWVGAGSGAGGFDFAGFLSDYIEGEGSVGLFGGEGPDGLFFGEPFAGDGVGPAGDAVGSGVWGVADPVAGGESVGAGYRFVPGVNQANYGSGDERFRVNCLEAFVAFHNSLKFGRQFVAGLVVIGIRFGWRWRSGRQPCGWVVWPGLSSTCAVGRWVWRCR